jgi:hypothetical protein
MGGGYRTAGISPGGAGVYGGGYRGGAGVYGGGYRSAAFAANGFRGGGFRHHHGFRHGGAFALGVGLGYGLYDYGPYAYYGDDYYDYPYYAAAYDDYDGGCYIVKRRVQTAYGWRIRRVQVCN